MNRFAKRSGKIITPFISATVLVAVLAATLFLASARMDWTPAWAYLAVYVGFIIINWAILRLKNPGLIVERARWGPRAETWDKVLSSVVSLLSLGVLFTSGLDVRFGWSPPSHPLVQLVALLTLVIGFGLFSLAMQTNAYFASVVRIQTDRGHTVVTSGPYRIIRHPGYGGMIICLLSIPGLLGSRWALLPAGIAVCLMVVRTLLEDRTLRGELVGYAEYAQRVRHRLVPGIW